MIISCACGAKLKIGDEKLTAGGVKIRCPKCRTVHVAQKPLAETPVRESKEATTVPSAVAPAVAPPASEPMPWFAPASAAVSTPVKEGPLVLVAHDSQVVTDMIDGVLKDAGIVTVHASNGLEALKMAMDMKPQAMVVDVGLTGIYGFELCERLKGDPATKGIKIILLSSVYGLTAYKREPVNLYGADDYIEKHHIPDDLVPKLRALLSVGDRTAQKAVPERTDATVPPAIPRAQQAVAPLSDVGADVREQPVIPKERTSPIEKPPAPAERRSPAPPEEQSILPKTPVTLDASRARSTAAPLSSRPADPKPEPAVVNREDVFASAVSPEPPSIAPEADASVKLDAMFFEREEYQAPAVTTAQASVAPEEIEKAKRFARIIVSDIALYNQEAVVEGIRKDTFYEVLKDDIAEGRSVYDQRVPEAVRRSKDYLQEALDDFVASKKKLR